VKRIIPPAPHTPGPWRVYQEKPHYYSVGTDYANDRGHDCNIVRDVRCEANARLMATAPELLTQLKALVVQIEHAGLIVPPGVSAAIAKAEGRSQ
jgi:hypothetical protein